MNRKTKALINLNCLKYGMLEPCSLHTILHNIKQFFKNFRYARQRITQGYCDYDKWDLNFYLSKLLCNSLDDLANNHWGTPTNHEEIKTDEDWVKILKEISKHFYNATDPEDSRTNKKVWEAYDNMKKYITKVDWVDNGDKTFSRVETYSDELAYNKAKDEWLDAEKINDDFVYDEAQKGLKMLQKYYFNLWD